MVSKCITLGTRDIFRTAKMSGASVLDALRDKADALCSPSFNIYLLNTNSDSMKLLVKENSTDYVIGCHFLTHLTIKRFWLLTAYFK